MNFSPVVYEHAASFLEKSPSEVSRNAELLARAHIEAYKCYGQSPVTLGMDIYNLEAESYGASVPRPGGMEVPTICKFPFAEPEGILELPPLDLNKSGRWPLVLEAARIVQKQFPQLDIRLPLGGPFSIAVNLCGFENFLMYSLMNEDSASTILHHIADHQIKLAAQIIDSGFGVSFFESAATPPMLSPDLFRSLDFPVLRKIITELNDITGSKAAFILGGDTAPISREIFQLGAGFLICPSETDQDAFLQNWKDNDVTIRINMDAAILASGNREAIGSEVDRIKKLMIKYPGTIAGSGVLPYNADPNLVKEIGSLFEK